MNETGSCGIPNSDLKWRVAVGATLLVWELESADNETRLVGAVEFQSTGSDRAIHSQIVREPVNP
jgi:hypothetical protein